MKSKTGHPVELLAGYWTIAGRIESFEDNDKSSYDFLDRVEAAARAGYKGIGLKHADLMAVVMKYGFNEMKAILEHNDIKYLELEALFDWFTDGERRNQSNMVRKDLLKAAERLNARHLKVVGDFLEGDWPIGRMAECFNDLCAEAANAGALVGLEIMPFSNVFDIPTALSITGETDSRNGGLLLDIWHINRGGIDYEEISRIPKQKIVSVELNDADKLQVGSMMEDTINRRKLCGQGDFDIPGFIRSVLKAGYEGPFGVEILSEQLRVKPLESAAKESFDTAIRQFALIDDFK
jgi:sugar phosphate isomerase/epimerase